MNILEIKIYYEDVDWDPNDEDIDPSLYQETINWEIVSDQEDKIRFSIYDVSEPMIDSSDQLYYSQTIALDYISPNWNGNSSLTFVNNTNSVVLYVRVDEINDPPYSFNTSNESIETYNNNEFDWLDTEIEICQKV